MDRGTYISDWEIGEKFPNFMLIEEVRPYCGVDIIQVNIEEGWEIGRIGVCERWERNMMGKCNHPVMHFRK